MKKFLGVVLAGLLSVACAACGGSKSEAAVCTLEIENVGVVYEMTLEAENDIVHTLTQVTTVNLSAFPEDQIALLDENIEQYEEVYKEYEGTEYSAEVKDNMMYETIVIDLTNTETVDALREAELLPIEGESNGISLEKTMENLESLGWTVEKK